METLRKDVSLSVPKVMVVCMLAWAAAVDAEYQSCEGRTCQMFDSSAHAEALHHLQKIGATIQNFTNSAFDTVTLGEGYGSHVLLNRPPKHRPCVFYSFGESFEGLSQTPTWSGQPNI